MDYKEAIELIDGLLDDLDEIPESGEDFAESVRDKITSMREWIEDKERVTEKMETALMNMQGGINKWLHR